MQCAASLLCGETVTKKRLQNDVSKTREAPERRATINDVVEARNSMLDVVCKGSTVAIASADVGEDNYVLKVISDNPEMLTSRTRDDFNASYPAGATVI